KYLTLISIHCMELEYLDIPHLVICRGTLSLIAFETIGGNSLRTSTKLLLKALTATVFLIVLGSMIRQPPASYSHFGVLSLKMSYETAVDQYGNTLYFFVTADGVESPTLHVKPGDRLMIQSTNLVPAST